MKPLVIVRPEPGATATATAAKAHGLEVVLMPLFAVEPVAWRAPSPEGFDALLLTSANAIRHGGPELERLSALPAHCVGEATAAAARDAGFAVAGVGSVGVEALLRSLPPDLRLLHLCGVDHYKPQEPSQSIARIAVYRSENLPRPENFGRVEGSVVAVHSPRAATHLAELVTKRGMDRQSVAIAAISSRAAAAAGDGWARVEAADEPDDSSLLALACRLCKNRC
jgi:uroporphyrinogen-III synthase